MSSAAVWGLYPSTIAFEIVTPSEDGWTESRIDGMDVRNNSIRMLRTFRFTDDNGTELTSHDFLPSIPQVGKWGNTGPRGKAKKAEI